jgi:6-phosphofructokinase 1
MRVGILTGGGDCPGLNAVIRAVTRKGIVHYGFDILGIKNGWLGLIEGRIMPLDLGAISGILPRGGTILGTTRTNPFKVEDGVGKIFAQVEKFELDAVIAVGGEDTLGVAKKLHDKGLRCVGVPKTIDNDLCGTDYTFGFDTAVSIVAEALDRLHTTAEAHHRVMVVEVMGRHAGWIAVEGGLAGGADIILIPEFPFDLDEICAQIQSRRERGKMFSIVVVAEGARPKDASLVTQTGEKDAFGHVRLGGIGNLIAREIEMRQAIDTRVTVLGHIQRGGSPTAFDRILATRFGIAAIDLVKQEKFGFMVGLRGNRIVPVPFEEALAETKTVDAELYEIAKVFFG